MSNFQSNWTKYVPIINAIDGEAESKAVIDEENSFTADELKHKFANICKDVQSSHNIEDALTSLSSKYNDATICVVGSLYFAGFFLSKN